HAGCPLLRASRFPTRRDRDPRPTTGEVLLAVRAGGLRHPDLHIIDGDLGEDYRLPVPTTLGHEVCGVPVELGPTVRNVEIGRRYAAFGAVGCGDCRSYRAGRDNLCTSGQTIGRRRDEGYAD
ncbi:MAG: alcohol dehydrogenase catalytic domain-containing protein, partial [Thermomicrobium sp.]|nr:alcohol dehydrogenase catalytic domain-containing protein [Thermomicrobium sp.]